MEFLLTAEDSDAQPGGEEILLVEDADEEDGEEDADAQPGGEEIFFLEDADEEDDEEDADTQPEGDKIMVFFSLNIKKYYNLGLFKYKKILYLYLGLFNFFFENFIKKKNTTLYGCTLNIIGGLNCIPG